MPGELRLATVRAAPAEPDQSPSTYPETCRHDQKVHQVDGQAHGRSLRLDRGASPLVGPDNDCVDKEREILFENPPAALSATSDSE
jgi:hypothetical protein